MITVPKMQEGVVRKPTHKSLTSVGACQFTAARAAEICTISSGAIEFQTDGGGTILIASYGTVREPLSLSAGDYDFHRLKNLWRQERGATSSITGMALCPSYQRIIAMGDKAVPLIMRELRSEGDEPDMWFWALKAITGVDPVADEDRGDMKAMADAWLAWGESRYAW